MTRDHLARWPVAVLTAIDRLANAVAFGDDRQTISARAFFARDAGADWGIWLADALDGIALHVFGQPDHCKLAAEFDAAVRQLTASQQAEP